MLVVVNQFVTLYKSCDVSETVIQLKQQQIRRVADNSVQLKIIFFFLFAIQWLEGDCTPSFLTARPAGLANNCLTLVTCPAPSPGKHTSLYSSTWHTSVNTNCLTVGSSTLAHWLLCAHKIREVEPARRSKAYSTPPGQPGAPHW